jgi:hypothetical protein
LSKDTVVANSQIFVLHYWNKLDSAAGQHLLKSLPTPLGFFEGENKESYLAIVAKLVVKYRNCRSLTRSSANSPGLFDENCLAIHPDPFSHELAITRNSFLLCEVGANPKQRIIITSISIPTSRANQSIIQIL